MYCCLITWDPDALNLGMSRLLLYKDTTGDDNVVEAREVARAEWRNFWLERDLERGGIGERLVGT